MQAIVDENANNMEDPTQDPRLDPSNFLSTVDTAKLRAQILEKLRQKGLTPPEKGDAPSQESYKATGSGETPNCTSANTSTRGKGFGHSQS
jgi:hypothetical protein